MCVDDDADVDSNADNDDDDGDDSDDVSDVEADIDVDIDVYPDVGIDTCLLTRKELITALAKKESHKQGQPLTMCKFVFGADCR